VNATVPFSLSDILERIIPGFIVLALLHLVIFRHVEVAVDGISQPVLWFALLAAAYACGVLMNTLSGFLRIPTLRQFWRVPPTPRQAAIRQAIEKHFGVPADDASWSLCFGTVSKHGYGTNTQLFLGLEVFCRSMMAVCAVATLLLFLKVLLVLVLLRSLREVRIESLILPIAVAAFILFRRGARNYSQAFVASIYEGFFSWYCENRGADRQGPGQAGSDHD
jgi:hypothetical protein